METSVSDGDGETKASGGVVSTTFGGVKLICDVGIATSCEVV